MQVEEKKDEQQEQLEKEIDGAIDESVKAPVEDPSKPAKEEKPEGKGEKEDLEADEFTPAEEEESGGETPDEEEEEGSPDDSLSAITDEHVERAVKAGLSIKDAKAFTNAESLERVCEQLEAAGGDGDGGDAGESDAETSLVDSLPDLDPEEFDERIVEGFKTMKQLIRSQDEIIKGLKGQAESAEAKAEENREAAEEEARIEAEKVEALKKRKAQQVNRPSGNRTVPTANVSDETAAELDRKFFK